VIVIKVTVFYDKYESNSKYSKKYLLKRIVQMAVKKIEWKWPFSSGFLLFVIIFALGGHSSVLATFCSSSFLRPLNKTDVHDNFTTNAIFMIICNYSFEEIQEKPFGDLHVCHAVFWTSGQLFRNFYSKKRNENW